MLIDIFSYSEESVRDQIQCDARQFAEQNSSMIDAKFVTALYKMILRKYPKAQIDIDSASFEVFVDDPAERLIILALRERFGRENVILVGSVLERPGVSTRYSYILYVVDEMFCWLRKPIPIERRHRIVTDVSEQIFRIRSSFEETPLQQLLRFKSEANVEIDAIVEASLPQPIEASGSFLLPVASDTDFRLLKDHGIPRDTQLAETGAFFSKAQLREGIVIDLRGFGRVRVNFDFDALENEDGTFDPHKARGQYLVSVAKTDAELTEPSELGKGSVVVGGRPYYTSFGECSAPFFGVLPCRLLTVRLGFGQAHVHISAKDGKPRVAWVRRTE